MKWLLRVLFVFMIAICPVKAFGFIYTWVGFLSSDWGNGSAWSNNGGLGLLLTVPSSTDDVVIPKLGSGSYPTVVSGTYACKTITFNAGSGMGLTVNGTLNVSGAISQMHATATGNIDVIITGSGTITCASLTVGDNTIPSSSSVKNITTFKTNIAQLMVSGAITVNSASGTLKTNNAVLNIVNDNTATCAASAGSINVTNFNPGSFMLSGSPVPSSATINLLNSGINALSLTLTGVSPISVSSSTYGLIDLYTGNGNGVCTVTYAGASGQTVYTNNTGGLDTSPSIYPNLSFSGTGTKSINAGSLTLSGNWNSTGGNVDGFTSSSTVIFQGINQNLTDASSGVIFKNVNFNGGGTKTILGSGTGSFSVSGTGVLTMAANTALTLGTGGKLTLISDATGTASVAAIPSTSSITGNVNVQRYFKAGTILTNTRNYRLLSSPVNANGILNNSGSTAYSTLSYLNNNPGVFIAGPGGVASGFTVANATPTMYVYKESLPASNTSFNSGNFKGIANITGASTVTVYNDAGTTANINATLYAGNGFMLYYAGNNIANVTSTTVANKQFRIAGGNYIDPDAAIATAIGTLNQGNIRVRLWATADTILTKAQAGYNLVGNPYASTINWDLFSNSNPLAAIYGLNISKTIYVFNYANKNYGTYQAGAGGTGTNNASRYIASGQGFFVIDTIAAGGSLVFTEAAKTTIQPSSLGSSFLLMGTPVATAHQQLLRIKLAKDTINTDETILLFEAGAKNAFEQDNDAPRLNGIGNTTTLATLAANYTRQLAINHMHSIDSASRVKLYVNSLAGENTLSFTGLSTLDTRYDVYLVDHYQGDSILITEQKIYSFTIRTDSTASFGADRFEITCHEKSSYKYRLLNFTGNSVNRIISLKWKTDNEQNSTIFTIEKANKLGLFNAIDTLQSNGGGAYTWPDKTPSAGINTYRLKQTDAFGHITYSTVVSIELDNSGNSLLPITVYPNPAPTIFYVKINLPNVPDKVRVKLFSLSGVVVATQITGTNNIQQNMTGLMPGTYILEVSDEVTNRVIGRSKISKQ